MITVNSEINHAIRTGPMPNIDLEMTEGVASIQGGNDQNAAGSEVDVKIFIAAHKDVELFDSSIMVPIQVGATNAARRFDDMLSDADGDNISDLNPMYCELTAQYWAWKNVDADYYGFCHYRRYFNLSSNSYLENAYGEVMDKFINEETQSKYGLDDANIKEAIAGYDLVITEIKDIRSFPGRSKTPLDQYHEAPLLHDKDIDIAFDIVKNMYPEYASDVDDFANGHESCFCNMYIMRKEIFFAYCDWMFPILERFCENTDMSLYGKEALRTPGHISERLFNIFLIHNQRIGTDWKIKQVQCVHFEYPDKTESILERVEDEAGRPTIPVVFAADDTYVPMLTTTIFSMLQNASTSYFYDVIVLSNGIAQYNKKVMGDFLTSENAGVRFLEASSLVGGYSLSTNNEHIGIETYYRFLIQDVLRDYDKVLYLDSDLIVEADISELFSIELGDDLLAAVRDIDFLGNLNIKRGKRIKYNEEVLKMKDPYDYFQAGVLLLNTEEMRKEHPVSEWLSLASNEKYIYNDQDVLNYACEGRVLYLDNRWNVMNDCVGRVKNIFSLAPAKVFDEYMAARSNPYIIHYAGYEKPWNTRDCDLRERYWEYGRETPQYEDLLSYLYLGKPVEKRDKSAGSTVKRLVRKIADVLIPIGSERREFLKKIYRRMN